MTRIRVFGGKELFGRVTVSGAKNAVLPIIAASLLAEQQASRLLDVPRLTDVQTMSELLEILGATVNVDGDGLTVDARSVNNWEAPYEYVRQMRASLLIMGPLLARLGRVRMSLPGGCAIGTRPFDLHLKGLAALGATISTAHGLVEVSATRLRGNKVYLDFPSVGATENIMMAATLAEGVTVIENAAEEPEIVDLANFLGGMGARISGAGTKVIRVEGTDSLRGATHAVIPDRIEAGTYMLAAAAAGGDVVVDNVIIDHLKPIVAKLTETGVEVDEEGDGVRIRHSVQANAVDIKTLPYPGFPTDLQPQFMALLATARGTSVITETVFENRFMHVDELKRMGARIVIEGHSAVVKGMARLSGAPVKATDLRAGAALVIAGLVAEGVTEISCIHHIQRGYENIVGKLVSLGADIQYEE